MATEVKISELPILKEEKKSFIKRIAEKRFAITSIPLLRNIMRSRWYQYGLNAFILFLFVIMILAGFFGSQVGNANISIVWVWIVWWALLMLILVPVLGRFWCQICPLPSFGEWSQRGGPVVKKQKVQKLRGLRKRWPSKLTNMYFSMAVFLSIAIFSGHITSTPWVNALMLIGIIAMATMVSVFYNKRAFCRFLCPIGGFIGLYSQMGAIELRVKDYQVCKDHQRKECLIGNEYGFGCPWLIFPGTVEVNTWCGLCMECFKTCTEDNVELNIRPFGADMTNPKHRTTDEAFKTYVMLGAALLYSVVLMGTINVLKDWASFRDFIGFLRFAAFFLGVVVVLIPAYYFVAAWISTKIVSDKTKSAKQLFTQFAYANIPMGLMGWIAFTFLIILPNYAYIFNTLNDPFGWGWNLLGIIGYPQQGLEWLPILSGYLNIFLGAVMLIGLVLSLIIAWDTSKNVYPNSPSDRFRAYAVHVIFLTIGNFLLLTAFIG